MPSQRIRTRHCSELCLEIYYRLRPLSYQPLSRLRRKMGATLSLILANTIPTECTTLSRHTRTHNMLFAISRQTHTHRQSIQSGLVSQRDSASATTLADEDPQKPTWTHAHAKTRKIATNLSFLKVCSNDLRGISSVAHHLLISGRSLTSHAQVHKTRIPLHSGSQLQRPVPQLRHCSSSAQSLRSS